MFVLVVGLLCASGPSHAAMDTFIPCKLFAQAIAQFAKDRRPFRAGALTTMAKWNTKLFYTNIQHFFEEIWMSHLPPSLHEHARTIIQNILANPNSGKLALKNISGTQTEKLFQAYLAVLRIWNVAYPNHTFTPDRIDIASADGVTKIRARMNQISARPKPK